jgi:pimeloyl-ACP methyl ester carboxylesterase
MLGRHFPFGMEGRHDAASLTRIRLEGTALMRCISKDGTSIAFERRGSGEPVILIPGALCDRATGPNKALAKRLADDFSVEREIEDLDALIDAVGGSAQLYGISSGGALALDAAASLTGKITRVAVYEIPMIVDDSRPPVDDACLRRVHELLATGRRGAAVKLFMRDVVRVPAALVPVMPLFPGWSKNKAHAPTLAYDLAIMRDGQRGEPVPAGRWSSVEAPTLVAAGAKSPAWLRNAAAQIAAALPNARQETLEGQRHYVKASALAPVLTDFYSGARGGAGRARHAMHARLDSTASLDRP